jgi:hypothetical protein
MNTKSSRLHELDKIIVLDFFSVCMYVIDYVFTIFYLTFILSSLVTKVVNVRIFTMFQIPFARNTVHGNKMESGISNLYLRYHLPI